MKRYFWAVIGRGANPLWWVGSMSMEVSGLRLGPWATVGGPSERPWTLLCLHAGLGPPWSACLLSSRCPGVCVLHFWGRMWKGRSKLRPLRLYSDHDSTVPSPSIPSEGYKFKLRTSSLNLHSFQEEAWELALIFCKLSFAEQHLPLF